MKRMLIVLLAAPLLALGADKLNIGEWTMFNGRWTGTATELACSAGTVFLPQEPTKSISVQCTITIRDFGKDGRGCAGIFWGWSADSTGERNQLLIRPNAIQLSDTRNPTQATVVPFSWPVGRPVNIRGEIRATDARFTVGSTPIASSHVKGLSQFALHVSGADTQFSGLSVKTR